MAVGSGSWFASLGDEAKDLRMLTVQDLTEFTELHCTLIAGEGGAGRPIRWAHQNEMEDPAPWLNGGELLMTTGLGIPPTPERQAKYLERLARAGVAGLAVGDPIHLTGVDPPPLTQAFFDAANELPLPIVMVSGRTPFIAIAQRVAAANRDTLHQRLATHLRVYETLDAVARSDSDLLQLVTRLSRVSGYELSVLTPGGKPLFEELPPCSTPVEPAQIEAALADGDGMMRAPRPLPGTGEDGPRVFLVPVLARLQSIGVLVAIAREADEGDPLILHHIATIISLMAAGLVQAREQQRREGGELFGRLLHEAEGDRPHALGDVFAGEAPECLAFAVIALPEQEAGWTQIHQRLHEHGLPHVLTRRADRGSLVVAVENTELKDVGAVLTASLPGSTIGLSSVLPPSADLLVARREARWALRSALSRRQRIAYRERADNPQWLTLETSGLELMVDDILGPIVEHDERTNGELLHTLILFLEENRSWKVTSERLFIHRQTLIHRVKRIEELSGRRLDSTEDVCDLWLAIKARQTLAASGPDDS
ncbi:MAG: PucR family transcriptional regulator ligand-binding domain-containing protein [Actinobacteria bacterium]|nr:PucR family transcriptional regulator ligand-binding domain-containing protein [Actinomycetota bacterium]